MHYIDLENLGPISSYNLTDLKKSITSLESYQFISDDSVIVNFYDRYRVIVVQFDLNGNFKRIIHQRIHIPTFKDVVIEVKKIVRSYLA